MAWHRRRLPFMCVLLNMLAAAVILAGPAAAQEAADPLPSWAEGPARQAVLDVIAAVTDADGPDFVAPEDRIATFDNDGTLWVEKPTYVQATLMFERLRRIAPQHPEWRSQEPFRAVLDNDREALARLTPKDVLTLAGAAYGGLTQEEFDSETADAFVVLAGGPGTWEEFWEVAVERQIGTHHRPLALINTDGFYDGFLEQTRRGHAEGFLYGPPEELYTVVADAAAAVALIETSQAAEAVE